MTSGIRSKYLEIQKHVERLVTYGKKGTLATRRLAIAKLYDREITKNGQTVVQKLFDDLAKRYAKRNGGYTRILKTEPRKGDNAQMAMIQFLK